MSNDICPLLVQQKLAERWDRQIASNLLKEQEKQLRDVNADIDRLEGLLAKCHADQNTVLEQMEVNRSLLAPIRPVPAEVLGMIFFEYASDPANRFPHILALVCRRWRDVLYGTPAAWSFLHLALNNAEFPLEVHLRYLNRVRNYPISVFVDFRNVAFLDGSLNWAEWLCDRLRPHSLSRFEISNMDYGTPFQTLVPFFELISTDQTKNQISAFLIHFECSRRLSDASVSAASQALAATSKLTDISVPLDLLQSSDPVLKQLTHLRLLLSDHSLIVSGRLEAVLQGCPLLESLTLGNGFPRSQSATITLPNLNHLCVSSNDCLPRIFSTLRTPKLRKLTLNRIGGTAPEVTDGIKAFVRQGALYARPPPLTHLTLNAVNCPERTLVWVLERIDTLQILRITDDSKARTLLINALVKPPGPRRGWLCPRLRGIELTECEKLHESQIRTLITARGLVEETGWRWGKLQWLIWDGKQYIGSQN